MNNKRKEVNIAMKKFLSRKFIIALLTGISGIALAFTELGGKVGIISGIIVTIISTVSYIIVEGKLDKLVSAK